MSAIDQQPVKGRTRRPVRRYPMAYKARILEEYESLDKAGKGALLRREGLYTSLIAAWRKQRDQGGQAALARPPGRPPADWRDKEIARLRRENERLLAALDRAQRALSQQGCRNGESAGSIPATADGSDHAPPPMSQPLGWGC